MEEDKLVQLFHGWDTNAVKSFNKLLMKFLRKDRTYCFTIENQERINVALGIQSLGYRRYYDRLFERTGMQKGFLTDLFFRAEDRKKAYQQQYYRLTRVKVSRMRKLFKKLREGNKKRYKTGEVS